MSQITEHINFAKSRHLIWQAIKVLDGTADSQVVGNDNNSVAQRNPTAGAAPVEPRQAVANGTLNMDAQTRLLISCVRVAGIGSAVPTATLNISRTGGSSSTGIVIGGIGTGGGGTVLIVDTALPVDALTDAAVPNLSDVLECRLLVNPNEAEAHIVAISVFWMPSHVQDGNGRGNQLSGNAFS